MVSVGLGESELITFHLPEYTEGYGEDTEIIVLVRMFSDKNSMYLNKTNLSALPQFSLRQWFHFYVSRE